MIKCPDCKKFKLPNEFNKNKTNKSGLQGLCRKCQGLRAKNRSLESMVACRIQQKVWYKGNRIEILERTTRKRVQMLRRWLPIFLEKPNPKCEVCGISLDYCLGKGNPENVCFDHKHDNLPIDKPHWFLRSHSPTPENIKIWKSCDFGTLCSTCNARLPTKNREQWVRQVNRYVFGEKKNEKEEKKT